MQQFDSYMIRTLSDSAYREVFNTCGGCHPHVQKTMATACEWKKNVATACKKTMATACKKMPSSRPRWPNSQPRWLIFQEAASSQECSHRNAVQRSTAPTGTIFVTIYVFLSRGLVSWPTSMSLTQSCSHRNSAQNGRVDKFTALTGTTLLTRSFFKVKSHM